MHLGLINIKVVVAQLVKELQYMDDIFGLP